jgi:uncharacterized heparinase superfamily protein
LLVDCGPHGALSCGHAHADALAIEFACCGANWLIDPGTFTYTSDLKARNEFRASYAHNVVTVDGESQSIPAGPFSWSHLAQATLEDFIAGEGFDYFAGSHDGYRRLADPVTHRREIMLMKSFRQNGGVARWPAYAIIRDTLLAQAHHRYETMFHFSPELSVEASGNNVLAKKNGCEFRIVCFGQITPQMALTEMWVSECYGHRTPVPVVTMKAEGKGPQEFISLLIPLI